MKAICLPRRNPSSFWAFLLSETDLLLEVEIRDDLVQSRGDWKFGKFFPETDRKQSNSSKESTISTYLIHNKASDGNFAQVMTWVLNRSFHTKNDCGVGNLSNCNSYICCLSCPTMQFCGNSTGIVELVVNGCVANVGIGIVP